jgi:phosphatidate cytidylyltransferase
MLRWRIVLSVLFSAALVALCWLDSRSATPGAWLCPLALVLVLASTDELSRMLAHGLQLPLGWVAYAANAAIVLATWAQHIYGQAARDGWMWPTLALSLSFVAALAAEVVRYPGSSRQIEHLAASAFAMLYVGLLFSFLVELRFVGPGGGWGLAALVSLILIVKLADVGAYVVGRLVGRRKLAPRLSPGKTIEGSVGGLLFAVGGSWLALVVLFPLIARESTPEIGPAQWLGYGLTVAVGGMFGDLAESLVKRELGRKDSSDWMPGFGGVLDLVDSLLLAAPLAYLWWEVGFGVL